MLDTVYYAQLVRQSGLSHDYIAHALGLTKPAYLNKATGCSPFRSDDMAVLKRIFSLSADDATSLFYCNKFTAYCHDRGITGADLARVLDVSPATARRYMKDNSRLKVSHIVTICRTFNISADDYF